MPKFGEWDVNDPASAEGFTVMFNKARNEKRAGAKADSPPKDGSTFKRKTTFGKPQPVRRKHFDDSSVYQTFTCFSPFSFSEITLILLWVKSILKSVK